MGSCSSGSLSEVDEHLAFISRSLSSKLPSTSFLFRHGGGALVVFKVCELSQVLQFAPLEHVGGGVPSLVLLCASSLLLTAAGASSPSGNLPLSSALSNVAASANDTPWTDC